MSSRCWRSASSASSRWGRLSPRSSVRSRRSGDGGAGVGRSRRVPVHDAPGDRRGPRRELRRRGGRADRPHGSRDAVVVVRLSPPRARPAGRVSLRRAGLARVRSLGQAGRRRVSARGSGPAAHGLHRCAGPEGVHARRARLRWPHRARDGRGASGPCATPGDLQHVDVVARAEPPGGMAQSRAIGTRGPAPVRTARFLGERALAAGGAGRALHAGGARAVHRGAARPGCAARDVDLRARAAPLQRVVRPALAAARPDRRDSGPARVGDEGSCVRDGVAALANGLQRRAGGRVGRRRARATRGARPGIGRAGPGLSRGRTEDRMRDLRLHAGMPIKPIYGPEDLAGRDADKDIGRPGEYPYTRGIHPHMYRDRLWTMRQYIGFGTPEETNARFKYLMAHGQDALNVAFDLPTQLGLDSDDPRAEGEVGRVGMAIDTLADMEAAFDGIPLDRVSVSLTINGMAAPITAMYYAVAEQQGAAPERVVTTPQNDILKEFIARGTWVYPVEPSLRLVADLIEFSARRYPRSNPVSVCGYHIREAGCTTAQEMAYGLAIAAAYVELMLARGMAIDDFAPRISFNFTCWGKIFEEVAKFRAGRRLYARMMRERFGATNPRSWMFRSLIGGGGSAFTMQEPENNIVRGAYIALAGALSGAQTMALPTYDEAYTIPSPKAQLIALRTMQICAEESGAADTADPLAGSYYVEALTNEMEAKILEELAAVERMGGIVEAVKSGALQAEVARQAYLFEQRMASGEIPKVAVNCHVGDQPAEADREVELYAFDARVAETQVAKLAKVRRDRDDRAARAALARLTDEARGPGNLMPAIMEAVKAYATLGEVNRAMKAVFGEHEEPVTW